MWIWLYSLAILNTAISVGVLVHCVQGERWRRARTERRSPTPIGYWRDVTTVPDLR
jgi:hypothetical protein